jgi:hypothetical protein
VVLFLRECTSDTGHTVIYPGSRGVKWSPPSPRAGLAHAEQADATRVLALGEPGDMYIFDSAVLHNVAPPRSSSERLDT